MTTTNQRFFHISLTSPALSRLEEAESFFLANNLNESLAAAQQAWQEHPRDPDVFRVLAYIHMARGEYPPAAQAAYQAVLIDTDNAASYATLCQVYLTFNLLGNAEETLKPALARFPHDASLLVLAADMNFRMHRDETGAMLAKQALEGNPHDAYAKALLGVYHLKKKRYTAAAPLLTEAVQAYPQRWDYLRDCGIALLHTRQYAEACDVLARSALIHPIDIATKQHLWYAIRQTQAASNATLEVSFFFHNFPGFGWTLNIAGWLCGLIGFFWFLGTLISADYSLLALPLPLVFALGGAALVVLTHHGLAMRMQKGKKFDTRLWRMMQQAKLIPA